jgi:hypothetical protein
MFPNPFAGMSDALKAELNRRIGAMFADINAEESPIAYGVKSHGPAIFDMLDGVVHAIAELEKQVNHDKAA